MRGHSKGAFFLTGIACCACGLAHIWKKVGQIEVTHEFECFEQREVLVFNSSQIYRGFIIDLASGMCLYLVTIQLLSRAIYIEGIVLSGLTDTYLLGSDLSLCKRLYQ